MRQGLAILTKSLCVVNILLALERGVLRSALGSTARGHDQVNVPCILLFKDESVGSPDPSIYLQVCMALEPVP